MSNTANVPTYPTRIDKPFADAGDVRQIENTSVLPGAATWEEGFPAETSKELEDGGVPPSRADFNYILKYLSSWAFYLQSGGQSVYDPKNNYTVPSHVYWNGKLYHCKVANGPGSGGAKVPSDEGSKDYWGTGLGNTVSHASFGTNANLYVTMGNYFIKDEEATINFPRPGTGGFLTVLVEGDIVNHAFVLRDDPTHMYTRSSSNKGTSWTEWSKVLFASDVRNAAYKDIYIHPYAPDDAIGEDGDIWIQYI